MLWEQGSDSPVSVHFRRAVHEPNFPLRGGDEEVAAAVFPTCRERILYLTELLWKYPPFCYNDYEKEMRRINTLFDERNLLQIRTPDSEFQTEFLRFCVGIIRIPMTA